MIAISTPKIRDLRTELIRSQGSRKFWAEVRKTTGEIRYIASATNIPPANPVRREITVKRGNIKLQARTRGITR
jgi:hypothetical protein